MFEPPASAVSITTEVFIAAPAEAIWPVLLGFQDYGTWNNYMVRIDGVPNMGEDIVARTRDVSTGHELDHPVVVEALTPFTMHWKAIVGGSSIFQADHFFVLEPLDTATTLFRHYEYFSGSQAEAMLARFKTSIRQNFTAFNDSLKRRCEKR